MGAPSVLSLGDAALTGMPVLPVPLAAVASGFTWLAVPTPLSGAPDSRLLKSAATIAPSLRFAVCGEAGEGSVLGGFWVAPCTAVGSYFTPARCFFEAFEVLGEGAACCPIRLAEASNKVAVADSFEKFLLGLRVIGKTLA
jgi:hypothetical protein